MGRAPCCDKANVKRGPWSPEEDQKLKSYIENHGTGGNWIALPQKIGLKRCGKSCRLRWLNYLRPNIRHGGFTEDEDNLICSLYISIGSRWSIIAAQLPGRTDNDIKNYWNTRLKKKLIGARQRRENRIKGAQNQDHSYNIINEYYCSDFRGYPPPPHASLADIPFTTPTEPRFMHHTPSLGNTCYEASYDNVACAEFNGQKLSALPSVLDRLGGSDFQGFIGAPPPPDYVPVFDMVHGMPEKLDGGGLLSAVEMITSWGDRAADACPRKMATAEDQWARFLLDEQRLLGYSE